MSLKVIDLFCGAGGLSEGFRKAGYNILLGIDSDSVALQTYKLNHPESSIIRGDISKIEKKDILETIGNKKIDIIIGGPPCQGFSMAGNRNPEDPRNFLIKQFLRIVSEINPKFFVIENVSGLLSMKNSRGKKFIDEISKKSKKLGYLLTIRVLKAEEHGVSQKRKRVFIVGSKIKIDLDIKKEEPLLLKQILLKKEEVPKEYFYSKKMIKGFRRREMINKRLGRGFGWKFIYPEGVSYTISARYYKDGAEALVKYSETEIRKLTPEECALIQSFPKNYIFWGNKREIYRQIGNAVPPQLSLKIAEAIKNQNGKQGK